MSKELVYTKYFYDSLDEILDYIRKDSDFRASNFLKIVIEKIENLKDFPNLGFKDKLGLSKYIVDKNYIVYYYIENSKVYILGLRNVKLKK